MTQDRSITGFIVKSQDLSEADLLLTFFSEQEGKVRAVVKSAKKMTSKLSGNLQPYNLVRVALAGNGGLSKVINVVIEDSYASVMNNPSTMNAVLAIQELVLRALADEQPNRELFLVYRQAMELLRKYPNASESILVWYYAHSLQELGLSPRLLEKAPAAEAKEVYFSLSDGQFSIHSSVGASAMISVPAYSLLVKVINNSSKPESLIEAVEKEKGLTVEVLSLLTKFASFQLERELKASHYFTVI